MTESDTIAPVQLHYPWAFWFMHRAPGSKVQDYNNSIKKVASFATIQEFWAVYSYLKRPNEQGHITEFHLFKQGIRPIWEDSLNGGKWILRVKKGLGSRLWESLVLAVIGDQFEDVGDEICGAVISIRNGEDILSLWNKNASDDKATIKIRQVFRRKLFEIEPPAL